jgi:hypothetical protein
MKNVVKFLVEHVFTFGTAMLVAGVVGLFLIVNIAATSSDKADKIREQNRLRTEACYDHGMILVTTDAGPYCVTPQSLVKVK